MNHDPLKRALRSRLHHALASTGAKASKDTVIDYVSYIKDTYLVFTVDNLFAKFADREGAPRYYFSDNDLLNLFLFRKDTSLLENAVATHLRRTHRGELYFLMAQDRDFLESALMDAEGSELLSWLVHDRRDAAEAESDERYRKKLEEESRAHMLEFEKAAAGVLESRRC